MPLAYSASGDVTGPSSPPLTIIAVKGTSANGPRLVKVEFGFPTGADATAQFMVKYITADGTGTAGTALFTNKALGRTPICTVKTNYSAEPTYESGNGPTIDVYQRAPFTWYAPDDMQSATGTGKGWGIVQVNALAVAVNITVYWEE